LPDPICHASMLRLSWPEEGQPGALLFCNCANADEGAAKKKAKGLIRYNWSDDARKDLTVRVSLDEGNSFSRGTRIAKKGGYSDMAATADARTVVAVFETGWDDDSCIFPRQLAYAALDRETIA
ncbi:MAG: exo-alpha-sialidase, partial [Clostridiales bacterium]|nr:exo-alpha-sialidase [Clostridiales bacterium]